MQQNSCKKEASDGLFEVTFAHYCIVLGIEAEDEIKYLFSAENRERTRERERERKRRRAGRGLRFAPLVSIFVSF